MGPLKIALIQSSLPSRSQGGVGHFTDQLANRLVERGHVVTVFSLDEAPDGSNYAVVRPVSDTWYLRGRLGRVYGFGVWLALQDFAGFDVVHAMGDNHFLRTGRTPVVRTLSGSALAEAMHARRLVTRAFFLSIYPLEILGTARATRTVGISAGSLKHFPFIRPFTIPEGIPDTFYRRDVKKSEAPSILFVGHRLRDRKRAFLLIEVFQRVIRPVMPMAELWLVSDDPVDNPGVRHFSKLPIDALAHLYEQAWVFCLPSSYEGFGRPYAEAMASGTPVVATPNPGALEVLANGQFGVISSAGNLGEALLGLLGDPRRREALATAGRMRAEDFRWGKVAAQYELVYADALDRQSRR
jgi:glycosyltransferase involved in cell wall biosynthesis